MNRQGLRHLKNHVFLGVFVFISMLEFKSWSQEIGPSKTQFFIQTKSQNNKELQVLIKNIKSGKSSQVVLSPLKNIAEVSGGRVELSFEESILEIDVLEFYLNEKKVYAFNGGFNSNKVYRIYLFSNSNEKDRYAKYFDSLNLSKAGVSVGSTPLLSTVALAEAQKKDNERKLKAELEEAKKRSEALKKIEMLKEDQKRQLIQKAESLSQAALNFYKQGSYDEASRLFSEASTLNPSSNTYYYQYGVALYKTDNFEKSLLMLSLAEGEEINKTELTYFQALNHLKLENFDQALEEFIYVREENDESLSGIAAFFAGYISFQKQKYKEARNHFEFSLDHTRDVNLDKQAEGFLEEMDRVELFESKAKEKLRYSFVTGFGYDQNVLNVVNQDAATDIDAVRFNYGGSLIYRFKYDYKNEWSGEFNFFDTYSLTNQFKPDSTVQSADPLILSFGLPFHRQGTIGERPVVWGMNPSYQIISMSLDGGPRKQILNSFLTKFDLNFLLNSLWLSSYRFEYSMDQSGVTAASAENELSGVKLNLGMTQTRLLDTRGMQSLNYSLDLSQNQAKGDNYYYNKWTAGVGFNDKLPRDFDGSLKLDYSYQDYPKASEARSDQLISLMGSVSKEILPPIIFNFSLQYNISASDVSAYNYNKYLFNFSLTYSGSKSK